MNTRKRLKLLAKQILPVPIYRSLAATLRQIFQGYIPVGKVNMGSFNRLTPISKYWGGDRGLPINRYYIPMYHRVRKTAARVPFLRSTWHFAWALAECLRDPWRNPSYFERLFAATDPWQYGTSEGKKRLSLAASMLERVQQGKFQHALEIGCAEGVFTEMLEPHCESLLTVDFAPTALHRARQRLPHAHIRFELFDLLRGPIHGRFDLITAMDVLDYIFRPAALKRVRDELIGALEPGGYLLLVNTRQDLMFETEWWGGLLLRGGKNVQDLIGGHPSLHHICADITETHVFALFRKDLA